MLGALPAASDAQRRSLLTSLRALVAAALLAVASVAHSAELRTIAMLDFDLVDDQHEFAPATVEYQRLPAIRDQLESAFAANGLYRVVDIAPARAMIDAYLARTQTRDCNGCELDIGRALGADRVLIGWVQKVSNLILNINIQIEDVASGAVVLNKSVDLRGNTDESWRRGVAALVRSIIDKDQGNR